MKNFITRILFVGLALPALFALIILVPYMNHLPIAILSLLFTVGSALELRAMMEPEKGLKRSVGVGILSSLPFIAVYTAKLVMPDAGIATTWLGPAFLAVLAGFIVSAFPTAFPGNPESIRNSITRSSLNALYLIYPGLLASSVVVILGAPDYAGFLLTWFALIVFGNDSLAWLFGVTLGKKRGIFIVSPNKSLEGLIAGMIGSLGFAFAGPFLFPQIIPKNWFALGVMGILCGIAVVTGDLFESAIKRAAGVKDSGSSIPGRGGILDSFDSLLFAAPVFASIAALMGLL